jgi:hypothetical protein
VASSRVYEVRCPRCQTSFAPETRRCVHCGGPVHSGRVVASMPHGRPPSEPASGEMPDDPDEAQEEFALGGRGRGVLWVLMALLAAAGSVVRNCQGG